MAKKLKDEAESTVTYLVATPIKTSDGLLAAGEAYEALPSDVLELVACGALIAPHVSTADLAQALQGAAAETLD
jgi:hypothetical protein